MVSPRKVQDGEKKGETLGGYSVACIMCRVVAVASSNIFCYLVAAAVATVCNCNCNHLAH